MEQLDRPIARKLAPLAVAAEIGAPQHGVVARRQLLGAGLSRDQVDHLVAVGRLLPLYRGVYAVGHRPVGVRSREMAVVLLDAALAEALVRKLVTLEALAPRATGNLRRLMDTAAPTKSKLERDLRKILRDHGLPQPISNGFVCGYEVDLHWPEHRLVAELDGYAYHHHRRAFETDRERDIVLAAAGWQTVRVTGRQLNEARAATATRFGLLLSSHAW